MVDTQRIPYVYVLTPLTRIGNQRRTVMLGLDMERRTLLLLALSAAISIPFIAIGWMFLNIYAVLFFPLAAGAVFYGFSRSNRGLKQTQLRTLLDRKTSRTGAFMLCGRLIEPLSIRQGRIVQATVPVNRPVRTEYHD